MDLVCHVLEPFHIVAARFAATKSRGEAFQNFSHSIGINQFLSTELPYNEAQLVNAGHQAILLQRLKALANHALRNAVLLRKRNLSQRVTRFQVTVQNPLLDRFNDSLPLRPGINSGFRHESLALPMSLTVALSIIIDRLQAGFASASAERPAPNLPSRRGRAAGPGREGTVFRWQRPGTTMPANYCEVQWGTGTRIRRCHTSGRTGGDGSRAMPTVRPSRRA